MGVFVVEISATIGRRAWARTALAKGDRQHSYDVVASMLRSRVKSTLLFWAVGILGAAFALAVSVLPLGIGVSLAAAAAMVLCVLGFRTWSPTGTQESSRHARGDVLTGDTSIPVGGVPHLREGL